MSKRTPGLFVIGTDTEVGKTYVAALIVRSLVRAGLRVGVYKPAASGCYWEGNTLVSDDAKTLWHAAGQPGELERVCPQRFEAPVAPHLAAEAEGKQIDARLLRDGLKYWQECSDVVVVEGAGGLMSPLGKGGGCYVADLVRDLQLPVVIVSRNALGTINHTLLTFLMTVGDLASPPLAGIVLNNPTPPDDDPSRATNRAEISARCDGPLLAEVAFGAEQFDEPVDWAALAGVR